MIHFFQGGRFSCIDCHRNGETSVDFCCDCVVKNVASAAATSSLTIGHSLSHELKAARRKSIDKNTLDRDYIVLKGNYLDPNFMK